MDGTENRLPKYPLVQLTEKQLQKLISPTAASRIKKEHRYPEIPETGTLLLNREHAKSEDTSRFLTNESVKVLRAQAFRALIDRFSNSVIPLELVQAVKEKYHFEKAPILQSRMSQQTFSLANSSLATSRLSNSLLLISRN